ncbi:uncharacterized protein LOC121375428 [Gigantopelta aegis]|uniref:uncharacterized protein LOC121375428 n=1 Tax=Gigantopelta aegis TaxID=1735272 RepID=UPI001B888D53|nr:uncharacterized protein LOC121375428 [Gigantopelta aegis]
MFDVRRSRSSCYDFGLVLVSWCVILNWNGCHGICDPDSGPIGSVDCLLAAPRYDSYQWGTCLNDTYIEQVSNGKHTCPDRTSYCYYLCMNQFHGSNDARVHPECECSPWMTQTETHLPTAVLKARTAQRSGLPASCQNPVGADCSWYRMCLEKTFQCEGSPYPYAITFAEKMCLKFGKSYSTFNSKGQKWINAVRKCLQVTLATFLGSRTTLSCEEIQTRAFASHSACYVHPSPGAPSFCQLSFRDLWKIFWTVKSAIAQAPGLITEGLFEVIKGCVF